MATRSFSVQNPDALTATLRNLGEVASESTLRQAAVAGARVVFAEAKRRAPVGVKAYERKGKKHYPGFLRDHILIAYDEKSSVPGRSASYIVTWSKDAFYGRFVEHGTSKMPADPFLRPAFDARRREIEEAIDAVIQEKVKEAASVK